MIRLSISLLLLAGCQQTASTPYAEIADADSASTSNDAKPTSDDAGNQGNQCTEIPVTSTDAALHSLGQSLIASLQNAGDSGATADYGGDLATIHGLNIALDAAAGNPATASLKFIANISGSPFQENELAPSSLPDWSTGSLFSVPFVRHHVNGRATYFKDPALIVWVTQSNGSWSLISFEFFGSVTLASAGEVDLIQGCTPGAPSQMIPPIMFYGVNWVQCGEVGTYEYTSRSDDTLSWQGAISWQALDVNNRSAGYPVRWRIVHSATLVVAPTNYWSNINEADCTCGGSVGFQLIVDILSGGVIKYVPGINCVVC